MIEWVDEMNEWMSEIRMEWWVRIRKKWNTNVDLNVVGYVEMNDLNEWMIPML
jgi:hypothetical protein